MRNRKLFFALFILLLSTSCLFAQPDTLWTTRISGTASITLNGAAELDDGGFLVVGGSQQIYAARISSNGEVVWSRNFPTDGTAEQAWAAVETPTHNYIMVGYGHNQRSVLLYAISQNGDSLWTRQYNNSSGQTKGNDAIVLHDGNIGITGFTLGADGLHSDLWVLKCNMNGDTLWTRTYGGTDIDVGQHIAEESNNTLFIGGNTRTNSAGDYDFWAVRTDASGTLLSSHAYGTVSTDVSYGMSASDSVVYLAGRTTAGGDNNGYVVKLTGSGDSVWVHSYTLNLGDEELKGVVAKPEGGAMSVGFAFTGTSTVRGWLLMTNPDGVVDFSGFYGPEQCAFYGVIPVSGGGQLVFGQISGGSSPNLGYLMRLVPPRGLKGVVTDHTTGQPVGGAHVSAVGLGRSVTSDIHGRYTLALDTLTYDIITFGPCVDRDTVRGIRILQDSISILDLQVGLPEYHRIESSLNMEVHNRMEFSGDFHIANTGDGLMDYSLLPIPVSPASAWFSVSPESGTVAAGDTGVVHVIVHADTTDDAVWDFYGNLRVHVNSCPDSADLVPVFVTVLDADRPSETLPKAFSLAAYPNPFNPVSTLSLALPHSGQTRLEVFDITGRLVTVLADGLLEAGEHHFSFDGTALSSGIYFARVTSGSYHATQKMMLLK